jgi:arginase family enzyme
MKPPHSQAGPRLCSFELVEGNPIPNQHDWTVELACEIAASAFGQRIL